MHKLLVVVAVTGCSLYWNHGDDDTCKKGPLTGMPIESLMFRDPQTGQCESFGYPCNDPCGRCPALEGDHAVLAPNPDWAVCSGACEALTENTCLAKAGCRAAYLDPPGGPKHFWGCWEVAPSGPIHGSCFNLDAHGCSQHDDCIALYAQGVDRTSFESCQPKVAPAACSTLTTEAACKARPDCDPVYKGDNCTCDVHGCTCQTETFLRCQ
jgi:hypothetical protein